MSHNKAALYHSNGYNAQAACEHCEVSSATSAGVRHLIQLFVTPAKLLFCQRIGDRRRDYPPLARCSVGPLPHLNSMLRLALNRLS